MSRNILCTVAQELYGFISALYPTSWNNKVELEHINLHTEHIFLATKRNSRVVGSNQMKAFFSRRHYITGQTALHLQARHPLLTLQSYKLWVILSSESPRGSGLESCSQRAQKGSWGSPGAHVHLWARIKDGLWGQESGVGHVMVKLTV